MKRIGLVVAAMIAVGCGGEEPCHPNDNRSLPAREAGASCKPVRCDGTIDPDTRRRLCWFACSGAPVAASGCTPTEFWDPGQSAGTFWCPVIEPTCLW